MPEFSEDGGLLQALRDDQIPPSTLDVSELVASGRRKVRARNLLGAAAITAVLVAAIPLVLTNARSPNPAPPMATPSQAATVPTACTAELLPVPQGYENAMITGGDPSGRYLTGTASKGIASVPVVWDNGAVMPVPLPPGSNKPVVNEHGVIAGFSPDVAWVYRDGKFTTLPQPSGDVSYRPIAINRKGQIVGTAPGPVVKGQTGYPPLIWGANGGIEAVADRSFWVRGIDDDGTVIGQENLREFQGDLHGLIWRPGQSVTDLPTPAGVARVGGMSIRDGWVGGMIAYISPTAAPLKPIIFHLGTKESAAMPAEVDTIEGVNAHGWAVVHLAGTGGGALLAEGKVLLLPEPSGIGAQHSTRMRTISDDGRVLSGSLSYQDAVSATAVRWLCH